MKNMAIHRIHFRKVCQITLIGVIILIIDGSYLDF